MSQVSEAEWIADWQRLYQLRNLDDPTPEQEYEAQRLEHYIIQEGFERYAGIQPEDNDLPF